MQVLLLVSQHEIGSHRLGQNGIVMSEIELAEAVGMPKMQWLRLQLVDFDEHDPTPTLDKGA
jgi:hypothetical protein